jgi:hypothetical protein
VLLVGSFFYGLMMEEITSWLIFALWLMMAGVWLPNILQVVWWRFNAWGYLVSWIANLGASWLVVWVLPALDLVPKLPDYLQFWLLMAIGAAVFIPATLLTRPEPLAHLVRYYVMTRPLGWWGPVRAEALRRGLLPETAQQATPGKRPWIRREWTAEQAQDWTREDWIAIVLSPIVYGCVLFGLVRVLLLQPSGFALLGLAVVLTGIIYRVIDPKLRAVSTGYEEQQAAYVAQLGKQMRWEE